MGDVVGRETLPLRKMFRFDASKDGGSGGKGDDDDKDEAGGAGGSGGKDAENWDGFLEGQPENVQKLYKEHTDGLRSALQSERDQRKGLAKEVAETAKKLKEGSEERKALEDQAAKLEEAEQRAGFFEEAAKPEIGCSNPRLAFLGAQEIGAFDQRGNANWEVIKKQFPELFKKTTPKSNAGDGTDKPPSGESGMNAFIRKAAGR